MEYQSDIFGHQYVVVSGFVRHLAYFRALRAVFEKKKIRSHFWGRTSDSHLESATIDWCKVFGSDGPNQTHWKKTAGKTPDAAQADFRQRVLTKTGISRSGWDSYHKSMCVFRDKYVAHIDIGNIPPTPDYDIALQVAFAYDEWIRDLIKPDFISDPMLEHLYKKWFSQAGAIVSLAVIQNEETLKIA